MKPLELTPVQTLLRESITARINQTTQALCEADMAGNSQPMQEQPLELFTALAAQVASTNNNGDEIARLVHTGALFAAKFMKMQAMAEKLKDENEELRMSFQERDSVDNQSPIIEPDNFELVEPTEADMESDKLED